MTDEEAAHKALDRMGVKRWTNLSAPGSRSLSLAERVLELARMNRAAVPSNVWGGRG